MNKEEFKSYLTDEEFKRFIMNLNAYLHKEPFETLIKEPDFMGIIVSSFMWHKTIEGAKYWNEISLRKEPLKIK